MSTQNNLLQPLLGVATILATHDTRDVTFTIYFSSKELSEARGRTEYNLISQGEAFFFFFINLTSIVFILINNLYNPPQYCWLTLKMDIRLQYKSPTDHDS